MWMRFSNPLRYSLITTQRRQHCQWSMSSIHTPLASFDPKSNIVWKGELSKAKSSSSSGLPGPRDSHHRNLAIKAASKIEVHQLHQRQNFYKTNQYMIQKLFASSELEVRIFAEFLNIASVVNILITRRTSKIRDVRQEIKENGRKTSAKGLRWNESLGNHEGRNVGGLTRSIDIFHPWQGSIQ